ncbi:MAG: hypothetical protein ACKOXQ_02585 [Hydrogenophaga sp.]
MMAMHLAAQDGMVVPVRRIHALFKALCPDVEALARRTGWPLAEIGTLEVYADSAVSYVFPSRQEMLAMLPPGVQPLFLSSGRYPLSDCCPLLKYTKPL